MIRRLASLFVVGVTFAALAASGAPPAVAPSASSSSSAVATAASSAPSCPPDMSPVYGSYCTSVKQVCLKWMEPPPDPEEGRCLSFAPSSCVGPRKDLRFCIDTDEYTAPGDKLPLAQTSWNDAKNICEGRGRRMCLESEWNFACEGEEIAPYPTGLERPIGRCNFDQLKLLDDHGAVRDLRKRSRSLDTCTSPFGVRNMSGNVDEWTLRDVTNGPNRSALKGGWWMAARNRCRPATTAHGEHFRDFETGIRCCADAR